MNKNSANLSISKIQARRTQQGTSFQPPTLEGKIMSSVQPSPQASALSPAPRLSWRRRTIAFYTQAFGAIELGRLPGPELAHDRVGDAPLMLVDEYVEQGMLSPQSQGLTVTSTFTSPMSTRL
jgi:hypothetical protein